MYLLSGVGKCGRINYMFTKGTKITWQSLRNVDVWYVGTVTEDQTGPFLSVELEGGRIARLTAKVVATARTIT